MRIHIVGSGPTGMSIAWEILKTKKYEVIWSNQWEPNSKIQHASLIYENFDI